MGEIVTMRQAYIAGPMRGVAEFNFPLFDEVSAYVRQKLGWIAISPVEHDREMGFDEKGMEGLESELNHASFDREAAIRWDLGVLLSDATTDVIMLPLWWKSTGARLERDVAKQIGLEIWRWDAARKEIVPCR